MAELRAHWRARQEQRMALGIGKAPADSQVLATFDGKPRSPNAVTKEWTLAMSKAKLPQVTLHSLRHTHASMLIASGMGHPDDLPPAGARQPDHHPGDLRPPD